ncbi:MAG TPA: NAD-dependent epimerase/dehydratase family protein [Woeseiaceae bacterium]|nr:NAD-dependent epimerase/dehydratase family protein [Woeseiaceae bacterium]
MRVAISGATGFLGSHLVRRFLADGHSVAALARSPDKASQVPDAADAVVGDIADPEAVGRLVDRAEVVIHTVSNFRVASGPPESYRQINVEGTRNILEAAMAANVSRFVHCSTIGVHGHVAVTPGDENAPYNPGDLYQETKLEAEQLVRSRVGTTGTEIVVVRPCSMYGPGDLRMLKMFRMLAKGRFFKVGPCRENFHAAFIDDVVEGFLAAATRPGIDGEVFIVGGERFLPLDEYIDTAARAVGAAPPKLRLPYGAMHAAAWACERLCVPLGVEPPLHVRRVRFFRNNRAFSIEKARRLLGFEPRVALEDGMRRTVDWYRSCGLLPAEDTTR